MAEISGISWTDATSATARRSGPPPLPSRDGDKKQARQRINVEVRTGRRPHPNSLACVQCGHTWQPGERRHEYDHHLGYAAEHHYEVQPLCTRCHTAKDSEKAQRTHCIKGHEFTLENTGRKPNGTRFCRTCHREFDKSRRNAEFWRAYRLTRKGKPSG
jgi:hypothetical protein